ncbi:hypothetical protein [Burkholderia sp. WP9]|uniref:hypothetical protein n=1 Tax=Burkholderia sp. WP9 TaxID=1500263 RepID=UPI0015A54523|nr:hypothetical protein [Burkholderia sp. WP9]
MTEAGPISAEPDAASPIRAFRCVLQVFPTRAVDLVQRLLDGRCSLRCNRTASMESKCPLQLHASVHFSTHFLFQVAAPLKIKANSKKLCFSRKCLFFMTAQASHVIVDFHNQRTHPPMYEIHWLRELGTWRRQRR